VTEPTPRDAPYVPTVSEEYAERIRRWHENAYRTAKAEAGSGEGQTFDYLGRTIVVPPQVQRLWSGTAGRSSTIPTG
jgi:hypothetical protein